MVLSGLQQVRGQSIKRHPPPDQQWQRARWKTGRGGDTQHQTWGPCSRSKSHGGGCSVRCRDNRVRGPENTHPRDEAVLKTQQRQEGARDTQASLPLAHQPSARVCHCLNTAKSSWHERLGSAFPCMGADGRVWKDTGTCPSWKAQLSRLLRVTLVSHSYSLT